MNRKILLIIAGFMASAGLFAQTGNLIGIVTDQDGGEAVPFGRIQLFRAGEKGLETASDIDGRYKLKNIPDGIYTMKVHSVGYDSLRISDVTINPNRTLTMNIEISPKRSRFYEINPIPLYVPKKNAPVVDSFTRPDIKALPERKPRLLK